MNKSESENMVKIRERVCLNWIYLFCNRKCKYRVGFLFGFFAPSRHVHSERRLRWILQTTGDAVEFPLRSLCALLLDMNAVLFLVLEVFSTIQAVPHGCIHFVMELLMRK